MKIMSDEYCEEEPTRWQCPVCQDKLILGPAMTQEEKAWARAEGKKSYRNKWKHMVSHADLAWPGRSDLKVNASPPGWKKYSQEKQVDWIMERAREVAEELGVEL